MIEVRSPLAASVVGVVVELGQAVRAGTTLVIVESMKMEHEVRAAQDGEVVSLRVCAGDVVTEGEVLVVLGANLASRDTPSPAKAGDETSSRTARPGSIHGRRKSARRVGTSSRPWPAHCAREPL